MRRKNASSPRTKVPIELTPLLDVIFIILFIVIISNALNTKKVTAEAESEAAAARREVSALEKELSARDQAAKEKDKEIETLEAQLFDQEALKEGYEQRIAELEGTVIGRRVKIVSVSCIYDEKDSTHRKLSAAAPGAEPLTIDFGNDTAEMSFARLSNWLENYIETNTRAGADKSERVIIVLSVGSERILKRDREALDRIIAGLEAKYVDVY